jgi:NitT/TauT family transport system substrate-binding protein
VEGVKKFWQIMLASEFVTSQMDIAPFIDKALYQEALNTLAKENPQDPYWKNLQKVFAERNG